MGCLFVKYRHLMLSAVSQGCSQYWQVCGNYFEDICKPSAVYNVRLCASGQYAVLVACTHIIIPVFHWKVSISVLEFDVCCVHGNCNICKELYKICCRSNLVSRVYRTALSIAWCMLQHFYLPASCWDGWTYHKWLSLFISPPYLQ